MRFSGFFRGALDCMTTQINEEMKMTGAHAIAGYISHGYLQSDYIIPSIFDADVVKKVADAVVKAARKSGIERNRDRKKID